MEGFCVLIACSSPTPSLQGLPDIRCRGLTEPLLTNFSQMSFTVLHALCTCYQLHSTSQENVLYNCHPTFQNINLPTRTDSSRDFSLKKKRLFELNAMSSAAVLLLQKFASRAPKKSRGKSHRSREFNSRAINLPL